MTGVDGWGRRIRGVVAYINGFRRFSLFFCFRGLLGGMQRGHTGRYPSRLFFSATIHDTHPSSSHSLLLVSASLSPTPDSRPPSPAFLALSPHPHVLLSPLVFLPFDRRTSPFPSVPPIQPYPFAFLPLPKPYQLFLRFLPRCITRLLFFR
jgi:hypothetical protein